MADKKISQLTTLAQADVAVTADFLPIVDTSATETKKATPQALVQAGATGATLPVALGAVGTPSYTFTGDLNTGLWSPAADTVAVSTGGSERMRLDSSGNLGLGVTPSASTIAQFEGGANLILVGRGNVYASNNATFNSGWKYISTAVAAQYNISNAEHRWYNAPSGTAGNAITFTQAMTLDSSGNLGIGTASPIYRLHVQVGGGSNNIFLAGQTAVSNGYAITSDGTSLTHSWATGASATMAYVSNNLGIGTTSPAAILDVRPSTNNIVQVESASHSTLTGLGAAVAFSRGNDGAQDAAAVLSWNNGGLALSGREGLAFATGGATNYTATTEHMRLDSSGNLGIGTASPGYRLDVSGTGRVTTEIRVKNSAGNVSYLTFEENGNGNSATFISGDARTTGNMGFWTNSAERMRLDASGNLGIGTASPQSKFHVDGGDFRNSSGTLPALSTSIVSGEIHSGITNTGTTDSGYLRLSAGGGTTLGVKAAIDIFRESGGAAGVVFYTSGTERGRIDANGNTIAGGSVALATTATNGFLYVPTCAGTPTGTPTAITGMAPIVVNTTNNKLYFYSGGAWRDAGP